MYYNRWLEENTCSEVLNYISCCYMKKRHIYLIKNIFITSTLLAGLIASVVLVRTAIQWPRAQSTNHPNILIILADDMGYADLGSYGNEFIRTPNIDQLAQEGMRFNDFYSNGANCSPTRASLLSGQFASRLGFRNVCNVRTQTGISENTKLMPAYLKEAGYATYHIGKWHLGSSNINWPDFAPNAKGFDYFYGFLFAPESAGPSGQTVLEAVEQESIFYVNPWLKENNGSYVQREGHLTDILADEVVKVINQHDVPKPFFINYWPSAPHLPDSPTARWALEYPDTPEGKYAAVVSGLDENIGKILSALEASGKAENTIVIFASDNGGTLAQHPAGIANLRGEKNTMFEGGIKVPMIVKWPGHILPGSRNDDIVMTMDILPTLAEIIDLDLSASEIDGQSFLSLLQGGDNFPDRLLFWEIQGARNSLKYAVRDGRWKYVEDTRNSRFKYLFNVNQDPGEIVNLIDERSGVAEQMRAAYQAWRWDTTEIDYIINNTKGETIVNGDLLTFGPNPGLARVLNDSKLNPDNFSLSISLWVKPSTENSGVSRLVAKGQAWRVLLNRNGNIIFNGSLHSDPTQSLNLTSVKQIPKNIWTHITLTMEYDKDLKMYVNGVLDTSTKYEILRADRRRLDIGNSAALNQPFLGSIYNLKFFNDELTADEVYQLFLDQPPY